MKFKKIVESKLFLPIVIFFGAALVSAILLFVLEQGTHPGISNVFDTIWWSIVTMSTTGYGDIAPATVWGRVVALIVIIVGVLAMSLLTGTIASVYLNQLSKTRSGLMSLKKIKGHVVICGWRENMENFLTRVLEEGNFDISQLVVVADADQEVVDRVFAISHLSTLRFVRGNFYDKNILMKANIQYAKKIIVLADQTTSRTPFEIDSRTVMAVISIKALNNTAHVSAQLLERNFEIYLQRAQCNEIIFSKAINTEILSLIVNQDGMSNIISALVGQGHSDCKLSICDIPNDLINKTFSELEQFILQTKQHVKVLGVLENTGKPQDILNKAVREAEKTANFLEMIANLQQVKGIQPYQPVLVPSADYVISQYSSAILLERTHG